MAMPGFGGALFGNGEPADKQQKPKTAEELQIEIARLTERNKALEEQQKIQRDSYLQQSQTHNETTRLLREQVRQQITQQNPQAIPQATGQAPPSDRWEDILSTVTGGTPPPQQQQGQPAITPQLLKQVVRETLQEDAQLHNLQISQQNQRINELANGFKIQYPDLANNKKFTAEVDRVFASLRQQGHGVDEAWNAALGEAAYIHKNYSQRRQEAPKEQNPQGNQRPMVPGHQYLFPLASAAGHTNGSGKEQYSAVDFRPEHERFKDAAEELSASRLAAAERMFGSGAF